MLKHLIAIDPGLHSTGWAIFAPVGHQYPYPLNAGLVQLPRTYIDQDILVRANAVGEQVTELAQRHSCKTAVIEFPMHFGGSGGDAAARAGDTLKLAACVGAIAGNLHSKGIVVASVRVIDWKGQLPKDVVIRRLKRLIGEQACAKLNLEKDSWDACGIGMNHRGYRI
mgnify:CR=1 FL=1